MGTLTPLIGLAQNQPTTAKIQGFLISAGSAFRDTENELVELDGGVQLIYQEQTISCQSAKISLRSKKIEARGQVRITSPTVTIGGDHIILDYENSTGIIYNGFVKSGNVIFEGAVLQKVSDTEYYVVDADYTACTNCPASWQFSGNSIRAELGGYAYIKNSVIRSGPIPVFWLPYLIVPLKSDRQTGLLTPEFERTDSGGATLAQSAFWAISRNTDATFTLKNYELRGLKGLLEYRYVLNENSYGTFNYGSLADQAFLNEKRFKTFQPRTSATSSAVNRWYYKYSHYQDLPEGFVHRIQLNNASDLQYPKDFFQETQNHGDSAMENRISITKNTKDQHYSLDSSYYVNMLHADPLAGNDDAVHRLPELRYSQTSKYIGKSQFLYTVDLNYVNFARSSGAYDDLKYFANQKVRGIQSNVDDPNWESRPGAFRKYDGYFNPYNDLIRTGQRLDVNPVVYRSFFFNNAFEVTPKIGYRETHYLFPELPTPIGDPGVDRSNIRRLLRTEVNTKTMFSQIYGPKSEVRGTLWKHEIQPEIRYTRLPWVDHRAHPFFGFSADQAEAPYYSQNALTDEDTGLASGLQFDYHDRIYDRNLVTYSVTNRLVQKRWNANEPEYRQVGLLRLSQSYDAYLAETRGDDPRTEPWSDISSFLEVRLDNFGVLSTTNYYPYQKVSNTNTRVRFIDDKGRFIQSGIILKYTIIPGQPADIASRLQDYTLAAGLISRHLDFIGNMTIDGVKEEPFGKDIIKSYSYIAQFKPPGDCLALRFSFQQVVGGGNQINLNLLFSFDGKNPSPLSVQNLDDLRI